jgi:hypothetical protein
MVLMIVIIQILRPDYSATHREAIYLSIYLSIRQPNQINLLCLCTYTAVLMVRRQRSMQKLQGKRLGHKPRLRNVRKRHHQVHKQYS